MLSDIDKKFMLKKCKIRDSNAPTNAHQLYKNSVFFSNIPNMFLPRLLEYFVIRTYSIIVHTFNSADILILI